MPALLKWSAYIAPMAPAPTTAMVPIGGRLAGGMARLYGAGRGQLRPVMLPSASTSIRWAFGVADRPGMVRISPQIA